MRSIGIAKAIAVTVVFSVFSATAIAAPTISGQMYVDFDRDGNPYVTGSSDFDPDEIGDGSSVPAFPPSAAGGSGSVSWTDFSVTATDALGNTVNGTVNTTTGAYSIDIGALPSNDVMIQFAVPGDYQSTYNRVAGQAPTTSNSDANPLVWHLNDVVADVTDQHVGVLPPSNCSPEGDVFVTCYVSGDRNLGSTTDAMVRIAYDASAKTPHSSKADIGATWGIASHPPTWYAVSISGQKASMVFTGQMPRLARSWVLSAWEQSPAASVLVLCILTMMAATPTATAVTQM